MKPRSAKNKGRSLQNLVVKKMKELYPSLGEGDIRSTAMGQNGEDIQLSPAARKLLPFSVECKNLAAMTLYRWYEQAQRNQVEGTEPIVVVKENRKKPLVIVDLEYFLSNYGKKDE